MQIFVCIKRSAVDLADADGNVGAVVGNPFEVGHHIGKDKTKLDRAFSTLEPFDVVVLQAGIQAVNHLLEWFHFICFFYILIVENGEGQADNIFDCFSINSKLRLRQKRTAGSCHASLLQLS